MRLKERLSLPPPPVREVPTRTAVEVLWARTRARWENFSEQPPRELDLAASQREVFRVFSRDGSLDALARHHARWLPWFLFRPLPPRSSSAGAQESMAQACLAAISKRRTRGVRLLLHVFLRDYPDELQTFEFWRTSLERRVGQASALGLDSVAAQVERHGLLRGDGPERVGHFVLTNATAPEEAFREAGLGGELRTGGFARRASEAAIDEVSEALPTASASQGLVERLIAMLEDKHGRLIFEDIVGAVADALLVPFEEVSPPEALRETIRGFLFRHLHDPRVSSARWGDVSKRALAVFRRWLTERDLSVFFELVGRRALGHHWKYRRRFWDAYLDRHLISDAWLVLGARTYEDMRRRTPELRDTCGAFRDNAEGDKSALLLRIEGAVVVEWSHNGMCRLWLDNVSRAPKLFRKLYAREELKGAADKEIRHHASDRGLWQDNLAGILEQSLGVRVPRREYFGK